MAKLGDAAIVAANIVENPEAAVPIIAPALKENEEDRLEREHGEIAQLLNWIGFRNEEQVKLIIAEAFDSYSEFENLNEKDIQTLSTGFSSRNDWNGKIVFDLKRTKRLVALIHWCHNFSQTSFKPCVVGLTQQAFLLALQIATERATVKKLMIT